MRVRVFYCTVAVIRHWHCSPPKADLTSATVCLARLCASLFSLALLYVEKKAAVERTREPLILPIPDANDVGVCLGVANLLASLG